MDLVKLLAKLQTIGVTEDKKPDFLDIVENNVAKRAADYYSPETQDEIKRATPQELQVLARELAGGDSYGHIAFELERLKKAQQELRGVTEDKKPDADKDGVPDWADKKPGADDTKDKKEKANEDIENVLRKLSAIQEGEQKVDEDDVEEGNEFAQKVSQLKAQGAKAGTKFKTSDGKEHVLESEEECDKCGKVHEGACKEEDLKECGMSPLSSMGGMEQQSSPDRFTLTIQRGDKNLNVTTDNPAELLQLMKLAGVIQGAANVHQEPAEEQMTKEEFGNTPAATNEREPRTHGDIRDWGLPGTAKAKVRYTPAQQGDNPMSETAMFEEYKQFKQGK